MSQSETHDAADRIEVMNQEGEQAWWNMLGVLYRWRRFIVIVTSVMAVASVVISLMLPNWFKASSRLLLPTSSSGGIASALLGDRLSCTCSGSGRLRDDRPPVPQYLVCLDRP